MLPATTLFYKFLCLRMRMAADMKDSRSAFPRQVALCIACQEVAAECGDRECVGSVLIPFFWLHGDLCQRAVAEVFVNYLACLLDDSGQPGLVFDWKRWSYQTGMLEMRILSTGDPSTPEMPLKLHSCLNGNHAITEVKELDWFIDWFIEWFIDWLIFKRS